MYITFKHNKLVIMSSVSATYFGPQGPSSSSKRHNLWDLTYFKTSKYIYLVHIHALISLYQINTDKCRNILLTHHFINTIYNSDMFQPSKGHPQGVKITPIFTLLYDAQLCHATAWTSSCFFTDTSVIWLLHNTQHTAH